jgi:hypothetical protein
MSKAESVFPPAGFARGIGFLVAIMAIIAIGLQHATAPSPSPADAPASGFSAARAMLHVNQIAQHPHPTGSAQNTAVRNYLVAQLSAMGLAPQIQSTFSVPQRAGNDKVGAVHNIMVRLPGSKGNKALVLSAHYDSVPNGPGAADDGASVAAILETLRALKTGAPLQNDVIALLTDGEEAGLLGAEAFVTEHPWAKDVGLALNFEYRGNRGPFLMFETSPGNGALIDGLASAKLPIGSSMLYEVYKLLPNDTDMTPFKRNGIAGMNFAAIEGATVYHSTLDRPELLSQASLQHQGDLMLSLARHFGAAPLDLAGKQDRIYFDVAGLGLVTYPARWAPALAAIVAVLFGLVLVQASRAGEVRPGRIFSAMPFFLIVVALLALVSHFLWMGVNLVHPGYRLMPDTYNSQWYLLGFVALFSGIFVLLLRAAQHLFNQRELAFAAMACWLIALAVVATRLPGASFLLTWPLLTVLLSLAVVQARRGRAASASFKALVLFCGAIPALLLYAPLLRTLFIALSPRMMVVIVFILLLLLGLLTPLLGMLNRRFVLPAVPLLAALACLSAGAASAKFDDLHPRANNLSYVQSPAPLWVSTDRVLDTWTAHYFPADASRRLLPEIYGKQTRLHWTGAAPALNLPIPTIEVLRDRAQGSQRELALRVSSARHAPAMNLYVDGVEVLGSLVQGKTFSTRPTKDWMVSAYGIGELPLEIVLTLPIGQAVSLRAVDFSYGLPQTGLPPRPAAMMMQPLVQSDTMQAVARLELK